MALYLKYRPQSFAQVVGQEHIITLLEAASQKDQLVHSYLFYGPRGTGKTSVARILAKVLLIRGVKDEALQKHILRAVEEGALIDLIEIDGASNRGIDEIRDLREKIQFAPTVADAKVYIIDEVHMLTKEAFNALLKTLEEPPPHAYFILATTEVHKVPETIQSRCQRFAFQRLREEHIVRQLQNIADQERITVEREALRAIARHVGGSLRDAISALDQLSTLPKVTAADVRDRLGESGEEEVERILSAVAQGDHQEILKICASLEEGGVALEVLLRQLLGAVRSRLHRTVEEGGPLGQWTSAIDLLLQALQDVRVSPVPSVVLEGALLELCLVMGEAAGGEGKGRKGKASKETKDVKSRGDHVPLREPKDDTPPRGPAPAVAAAGGGRGEAREERVVDAVSDRPGAGATYTAREVTADAVRAVWEEMLGKLASPGLKMSLRTAVVSGVRGNCIELQFPSEFHRSRVQKSSASMQVESAAKKVLGQDVRIACALAVDSEEAQPGSRESVDLVEATKEVFGK